MCVFEISDIKLLLQGIKDNHTYIKLEYFYYVKRLNVYPLYTILLIIKHILSHILKVIIKNSPTYQIILDIGKHIPIVLETLFMLMEKELNILEK